MTKIYSILLLLILSCCSTNSGNKSAILLYQSKKIAKGSDLSHIKQTYGNYSANWQASNGNNIYQYSYTKNQYDLLSQLPIINHFGWVKSENYEIILTFDSKDKLISQKSFFNQAKSRNSLICNPEIYSCLRKVY